jgi:transposase
VRLIAPKFAAPYRMSGARGKNDAADAGGDLRAVQRPSMRFVPVKSVVWRCFYPGTACDGARGD